MRSLIITKHILGLVSWNKTWHWLHRYLESHHNFANNLYTSHYGCCIFLVNHLSWWSHYIHSRFNHKSSLMFFIYAYYVFLLHNAIYIKLKHHLIISLIDYHLQTIDFKHSTNPSLILYISSIIQLFWFIYVDHNLLASMKPK